MIYAINHEYVKRSFSFMSILESFLSKNKVYILLWLSFFVWMAKNIISGAKHFFCFLNKQSSSWKTCAWSLVKLNIWQDYLTISSQEYSQTVRSYISVWMHFETYITIEIPHEAFNLDSKMFDACMHSIIKRLYDNA